METWLNRDQGFSVSSEEDSLDGLGDVTRKIVGRSMAHAETEHRRGIDEWRKIQR